MEHRCLKWARMTCLDINTQVMVKRRAKSQIAKFDFWPLKVGNNPVFLACRWRVTYRWKALEEGYNFSSTFISIKGLHEKLWAPKVEGVPVVGISKLPFGSPETKWHLGASLVARHKVYYKGEGDDFPQVQAVVSLVSPNLHVVRPNTKNALTMHWPTCLVLCRSMWVSDCLSFFLVPSHNSNITLYPQSAMSQGACPQLLIFSLFSLHTHIWVYQGTWECVTHFSTAPPPASYLFPCSSSASCELDGLCLIIWNI